MNPKVFSPFFPLTEKTLMMELSIRSHNNHVQYRAQLKASSSAGTSIILMKNRGRTFSFLPRVICSKVVSARCLWCRVETSVVIWIRRCRLDYTTALLITGIGIILTHGGLYCMYEQCLYLSSEGCVSSSISEGSSLVQSLRDFLFVLSL